jgi:hypothetical protein
MNKPRRGQKDGQEERIKQYEKFFGATQLSPGTFMPVHRSAETLVAQELAKEVELIRTSLSLGVDRVISSVSDKRIFDKLREQLTPAERAKVHFTHFDIQTPSKLVKAE